MPEAKRHPFKMTLLLSCAAFRLLFASPAAKPQSKPAPPSNTTPLIYSIKGPDLYRTYCAMCHGLDAKGNGPLTSVLKDTVPNLTLLAKNEKGQFSTQRVRSMIDGSEMAKSHGTRAMPLWGPIFHQIENDQDLGNIRLDNLVKYLQSIQQK